MGKIILVTGGVRSGKSSYAEAVAKANGNEVLYLATGVVTDEEMAQRIAKHQADRPASWQTWERYRNLSEISTVVTNQRVVLLDDLGNLLGGIWFETNPDPESEDLEEFARIEAETCAEIDAVVDYCHTHDKTLILVTNEVGMGVVPESRLGRYFRDVLGRVNMHAAREADEVVLLVCGVPMQIK
jgi:adenosylcobinamide kinase/adenosylcobinamide-phosphate guanylyltransferase